MKRKLDADDHNPLPFKDQKTEKEEKKPLSLRAQAFLSDLKEISFDEASKIILPNLNAFSRLWMLRMTYKSVLEQDELKNEILDEIIKKETKNACDLAALKKGEFTLPQEYLLSVTNDEFFKFSYSGERDDGLENDEMRKYGRKKFHINMGTPQKEQYYKGGQIVYDILVAYQVLSFKILNWHTFTNVWKNEQIGKNITIYAGRSPHKNWPEILSQIESVLRSAKIPSGIYPPFDLPLQIPYCSVRNESHPVSGEYCAAPEMWEYHYDNELSTRIKLFKREFQEHTICRQIEDKQCELEKILNESAPGDSETSSSETKLDPKDLVFILTKSIQELEQKRTKSLLSPVFTDPLFKKLYAKCGLGCREYPDKVSENILFLYDLVMLNIIKVMSSSPL